MGDFTDSVLIAIFVSFPEAIMMLIMGFSLCNVRIHIMKLLLISGIQGIVAFIVIILHFDNMGIQAILQLLSLWVLVSVLYKMQFHKGIIPVLLGFFTIGILQGIYFPLSEQIFGTYLDKVGANFQYTLITSLPVYIIFFLLLVIVMNRKITFCHITMESEHTNRKKMI